MIVLSHRGYWRNEVEKNHDIAFKRSFNLGFGTETDVRDHNGQLVISHDMPIGSEKNLIDFLKLLGNQKLPLAINIKADGLAVPIKKIMQAANVANWFVFDMSIPDMRSYLQADIPVFARMSEVEKELPWMDQITGVWLDAFTEIWYDTPLIEKLLAKNKRVCIVSAELHKREFEPLWEMLLPLSDRPGLMICTDYPEQARNFFGES